MTSDVLVPGISTGTMHLGARYGETMQSALYGRLLPHLHEGVRILDVGGGRNPFLPPEIFARGTGGTIYSISWAYAWTGWSKHDASPACISLSLRAWPMSRFATFPMTCTGA